MSKKTLENIKKEYNQLTLFFTIVGICLLFSGLYKFIYLKPAVAVNARYLQPLISNGSFLILVGALLIGLGIFRIIKRKKWIGQLWEMKKKDNSRFK